MQLKKNIVFIGLGSNLGDRRINIQTAIDKLNKLEGINVLSVSSLRETEPVNAPGPAYINGVLKIECTLSPTELLMILLEIEENLGRKRSISNAPRTIDLDILLFGNIQCETTILTVPHPRMYERSFVMEPLLEIEPGLQIPVNRRNVL